jgi:hypothetical protein
MRQLHISVELIIQKEISKSGVIMAIEKIAAIGVKQIVERVAALNASRFVDNLLDS